MIQRVMGWCLCYLARHPELGVPAISRGAFMPVDPRFPGVKAGIQRVVMLSHHVSSASTHLAGHGLNMHPALVTYEAIAATTPARGEQALMLVVVWLNHDRGGVIQYCRWGIRD